MTIDPSTMLTWKDGILIGVIIGQWLSARSRRSQGERLGIVEKGLILVAKTAGVDLEESNPGGKVRK